MDGALNIFSGTPGRIIGYPPAESLASFRRRLAIVCLALFAGACSDNAGTVATEEGPSAARADQAQMVADQTSVVADQEPVGVDQDSVGVDEAPVDAGPGASAAESPLPALFGAELTAYQDDLAGLRKRGVLKVLVGYSHTHYFMDGMHIRGISAENLRQFEPFLHERLEQDPPINILPVPVARNQMIDYLAAGYADMAIGNITITPERQAQVDFSVPLRREVAEVIVHGSELQGLESPDDLSGRTVHVRASSSFYASLSALNEGLRSRGLAPMQLVTVNEQLQTEDILELVNAGVFAITVADDHMADFWSGVHENLVVRADLAVSTGRTIGWAVRPELEGLMPLVDEFVRGHREGTLVGNVLFQRYLNQNRYVHNAASSSDRRRFLALTELFKHYSSLYEFDWLLIAAQGYQESRLVQDLRSPAGAVGVMQLLPSTARAPAVGIPNIEELEANIHAGHKYLRHIADTYFASPEIDQLNRQLLSFAAYNAGPTRINRLRREAARRGLNPNEWFGQVERVVAERVGMEPVTYVRNIFKYYLTYQMILQSQQAAAEASG